MTVRQFAKQYGCTQQRVYNAITRLGLKCGIENDGRHRPVKSLSDENIGILTEYLDALPEYQKKIVVTYRGHDKLRKAIAEIEKYNKEHGTHYSYGEAVSRGIIE